MKQRLFSFFVSAIIFVGLLTGNASQVLSSSLPAATWLAVADVDGVEPVAAPEVTTPEIVAPEAATTVTESAPPEPAAPVAEVAAPKPTDEATNLLTKLETEIIPQIESVLTPEQQAEFATKVAAGTSFRKAFKAVTLTPAQKTKLSAVFKAIPKKDIFATLTPAQKKQLFLKNKQLFIPTAEEIGDKITAGMKMAKDKSPLAPSSESIVEKIKAKMKAAEAKE
ncbi:MAG: hypothetical protein ACK6CP_01380 [Pseudanabaena sp.]|jgi:hypothetical protein|nr:hypothetical protein [Pseudanabaena sp. M109S1SP2A07QC]MCA6519773.1 hypothetical protein [Pseudanabaena sp. M110S1SP2A07QC]MCA6523890.1 hypothetical protein [Pseudanabaena sp. M051S1SP2A07QC]MCA6528291.1 hypothetical protein [Pseudanabaena sp. M179S2SP2A07QC]MCA6529597.1 hypothetical protein [Pseudanabaena sp. M125S2SP2A07QC]MCA6535852.1 hypothetical protein [Pseudanabaena sp. M176S2SP2A07QC]MCA6537763.1 hypothetical protein [Pseudanabaena sp. M037S2SP2A07QC]MCA6544790.1 hypothetical prot